jgi:aminoglycoside phosphotransferase (APT) family kinase protein
MQLPDAPPVTPAISRAIAARHGLPVAGATPLPTSGIINLVYALGAGFVLRVPRDHPGHIDQARREAAAIPAARAAGVQTPRLVAYDDRRDLLPVPYSIVERVAGEPLERLEREPAETPEVWRALGRDFARLHTGVGPDGPLDPPATASTLPDPRPLVEKRVADGWFTRLEARWLLAWLDRLAPAALQPMPQRFLHGDAQAMNVLVRPTSHDYLAVIDWGCARWGDPAWDFVGMPLRAVPLALAGHREIAPLDGDETAEARIVWLNLHLALDMLPRGATPGWSWGERPLAMLLEALRFYLEPPPTPAWGSPLGITSAGPTP